MSDNKRIKTALVSVFYKDGLEEILSLLHQNGVTFLSTGGTRSFIEGLGYPCQAVEDLTGYPSILGGRVKTLHPKVFGGILNRRDNEGDRAQIAQYEIPEIDLVIVDLYPFSATVASGAPEADIIEKIDIGGISLIRGAAKNYKDVVIVASKAQYAPLAEMLKRNGAESSLEERRWFAGQAFAVSSGYDTDIFNYFASTPVESPIAPVEELRIAFDDSKAMRYGENPHQKGTFYGDFDAMFEQLHGKEISYNNLLDIDAAVSLISEFTDPTFAVLKHNNACGLATRATIAEAWKDALAGDPVSAFGGVLITNGTVEADAAEEINKIFFEVIIAPAYTSEALEILKQKKNRIILVQKSPLATTRQFRSCLNGALVQDRPQDRDTRRAQAGDSQGSQPRSGGRPPVCQQDCQELQEQRHCSCQRRYAPCQRRRPDLTCRRAQAGYRESTLVWPRPQRSSHGFRRLLPLPRLCGDSRRGRYHICDTPRRFHP